MQHFLPKEENCFCRLYILNYALRQIMGVTGHRYGFQHCFLCMQYVASWGPPQGFWGSGEKGYLFSGSWGALLIILGELGSKHILLGI